MTTSLGYRTGASGVRRAAGAGDDIALRLLAADEAARLYAQAVRPSLLQDPLYGAAYAAYAGGAAHCFAVTVAGADAGLVQIYRRRGLRDHMAIDNGPVWCAGYGTAAQQAAFWRLAAGLYPARLMRVRRLMPAVADNGESRGMLAAAGLRAVAGSSYRTIWRATADDDTLLRKNWRAMAAKAERAGVVLQWDVTGRYLDWLLRREGQVRLRKAYRGPSAALLRVLAVRYMPENRMVVGRALLHGRPVAGLLFILHGAAATYQTAWTDAAGRACGAQNLLLRAGLTVLKDRGIGYLDLGGVNDGSASAVKYFKEGLGGEIVTQPGIYR